MDTFKKHDTGKVRMELIPPAALYEVGKVATYGANKYNADNWRNGVSVEDKRRMLGAIYRHLNAFHAGESIDHESGLLALAHVACDTLFLIDLMLGGRDIFTDVAQLHPLHPLNCL